MLIKGIGSLKFCTYVGEASNEEESSEIEGLEERKLAEQYRMVSEPLFNPPNRKGERLKIMQLLKSRNEKRKLIKLLEKEKINSNRNDTKVSASLISQVEETLQKILHQEIQSLYQEVKSILFSGRTKSEQHPAKIRNPVRVDAKNRWPLKAPDVRDNRLSAVITEEVDEEDNGAFEMDDDHLDQVGYDALSQ